ncbi:MAG: DUF3783 domain-containing protein [Eubacteriales bacterium]|nr:DUF3783 domain-containing protein [Eubacteriales bacterium]
MHETIIFYDSHHCRFADELCGLCSYLGIEVKRREAGLPEAVLLFCHFEENRLDAFLHILKEGEFGDLPLMAMLTASNADWTPQALYEELCEERAALLPNGNGV